MADASTRQYEMAIRLARSADVTGIVAVHQQAFSGFFLSFLGSAFLRELYSALIADDDAFLFVAENQRGTVGFVAGTARPAGFYRRLLRQRWWRFGLACILPVLRRPRIVPRLLRALSMPHQVTQQEGRGTLMSIAVLPAQQGKGLGETLVGTFLSEAARRNLCQVNLTTDANDNESTNRFYMRQGFHCTRTYTTPEGRLMNEYLIDLSTLSCTSYGEGDHTRTRGPYGPTD